MLIQVSPWKTAKTSIRLPKTARRRKRDETKDFPATVSFVTTSSKRGLQKMKQYSTEFSETMPLMAITSDHQITVVGQSKEPSYEEYTSLKFSSRPGSAGAFFATPQNGGAIPKIPAILDAKNDRVYAFQHGNTRLCCWNSLTASGPDEKTSLKVELSHPALSMALLPMHKGIIYGTCQNGSVFAARVVQDSEGKETVSVEYLPTRQEKGSVHVGTFGEILQDPKRGSRQKRKISDSDGNSSVIFHQVFSDSGTVNLVSHQVTCERFSKGRRLVIESSLSQRATTICLAQAADGAKKNFDTVKLLISSSGAAPKAALFYTSADGSTEQRKTSYCALLSLSSGDISHHPVQLPAMTRDCDLVTETLVAVGTKDRIFIYDLETGSVLHSNYIGSLFDGSNDNWILSTNSKFSTISILYMKDDAVQAAFSVLSLQDHKRLPPAGLSLASKLASSMILPSSINSDIDTENMPVLVNDLLAVTEKAGSITQREDSVQKALTAFDQARSKVLISKEKKNKSEESFFLDTYEGCVSELVEDLKQSAPHHNPLDPFPSNGKRVNGLKQAGASPKKKPNGTLLYASKPLKAFTPSSLPQAFIDGAMQIVLSLLRYGKTETSKSIAQAQSDAKLILNRLLTTRKVSSRLHFEGSNSFQESNGEHLLESILRTIKLSNQRGKHALSPVTMILDMLKHCPDLSERQLVAMLNYMMLRSLPDDIAEAFMEAQLTKHHPYKALSRKYFSLRNQHLKRSGQDKDAKLPKKLEIVSHKLISAGTSYIVEQIIGYSECNEATLRAALVEGLTNSHEAIILAKILSDVLTTTPKDIAFGNLSSNHNHVKTTCQWIFALCESFQDDLSKANAFQGQTYLQFLLQSVNGATRHTQAILSLREALSQNSLQEDLEEDLVASKKRKINAPFDMKSSFMSDEEIPGYSIDRMVI
jgi:hypothetical protein